MSAHVRPARTSASCSSRACGTSRPNARSRWALSSIRSQRAWANATSFHSNGSVREAFLLCLLDEVGGELSVGRCLCFDQTAPDSRRVDGGAGYDNVGMLGARDSDLARRLTA